MSLPRLENAGVEAWLVRLFDTIDEANMPWLMALCRRCEEVFGAALVDLVPSYTTVLVHYDPRRLSAGEARACLSDILADLRPDDEGAAGAIKEVPVWYDESVGPELSRLMAATGLDCQALIDLHAGHDYRVFALGFAPGFAFMGSLDPRLEMPRLDTPRQRVPAGSVAVAGRQTSAYPRQSPGGWNLIGRTPITLFDRYRNEQSYLQVGDRVRFCPVDRAEFERLGGDTRPAESRQEARP